MRVILTHEQADFDALASSLAAHLLDEAALPVLPRRMNRNVRAFITIYGAELPFVEARDLPSESIEEVCLVDTQGMVTLRGVTSATRVRVIDHHPRREDLPESWAAAIESTGATVTVLIEALQEKNGVLNPIHATLLLLGIYEDTGSLTYSRTTPRDLNAAAFALSQGANLRIARDFLNHPLSLEQQRLYDHLRQQAQILKVHGHRIVIAFGNAEGMDEELSTIAHKLRDHFDPDALFLLLTTKSGVQLIARSTSDQIDVSEIASQFGGGGHDRASAALIRDRDLDQVKDELLRILPTVVRPAVTVAQIMSHGLQVLSPETSVKEAAERMQRYGYEGYPVVDQGRVVGLLTRRSVDRALSHKLNLTVGSLMNAGSVVVRPDDSVEYLQHVMTESGWGQIPVVDPESDRVIGIVTRTDLLKILTGGIEKAGGRNVVSRLQAALPPSRLALLRLVADTAAMYRMPVYVVGGFVRDLMLERPSLDFDIVVEGDAIDLAYKLAGQYGGRVTTHGQFGTAKWYLQKEGLQQAGVWTQTQTEAGTLDDLPAFLDLISARTEFYTQPTVLPTVERGSIKLDLHRRDFTINTLAVRLDGRHFGELYDYWGGLNDIRQKLVRVLHSLSFVDDPTRMLRAVRFEQRFGFKIEDRTLQLLLEAKQLLSKVTGDRIRHELDHIIAEPQAIAMLDRLHQLGLLSAIHPKLTWDDWLRERCTKLTIERPESEWWVEVIDPSSHSDWQTQRRLMWYCLWMMRYLPSKIESICDRIHYPKSEMAKIVMANRLWEEIPHIAGEKPSQIVAFLDEMPLLAILCNCLAYQSGEVYDVLKEYLTKWRDIKPSIDGNELRRRGLPPGPVYRKILAEIRNAWLDGLVKTKGEEEMLLEKLLAEHSLKSV